MATTQIGSNSAAIDQSLRDQAYQFGLTEGAGTLARADFCTMITQASKDGSCTVDNSDDLWGLFQKGASERPKAEEGGLTDDSKRAAQNASDLKHYITLGRNQQLDGPELLANARLVLKNMRDSGTAKGLRTWDIMLVWLRKQNDSSERAMDDSEIEDLFLERAKRATDELDRLTSVRNVLNKQIEIYEDERQRQHEERARAEAAGEVENDGSDNEDPDDANDINGIYQARDNIEARIVTLGGTRKDQRKAERARVREEKAAAKQAAKQAAGQQV